MEILSSFNLIYCFIALVFGAALILVLFCIGSMAKDKEPRNNVRFFVTKGNNYSNHMLLWLGKPEWDKNAVSWIARSKYVHFICNDYYFERYKLNPADFADMKVGEIREVFIDLED